MSNDDPYTRAFVVMSVALGRRDDVVDALELEPARAQVGRRLLARLAHGDRDSRAHALARELAPIALALEARRIG